MPFHPRGDPLADPRHAGRDDAKDRAGHHVAGDCIQYLGPPRLGPPPGLLRLTFLFQQVVHEGGPFTIGKRPSTEKFTFDICTVPERLAVRVLIAAPIVHFSCQCCNARHSIAVAAAVCSLSVSIGGSLRRGWVGPPVVFAHGRGCCFCMRCGAMVRRMPDPARPITVRLPPDLLDSVQTLAAEEYRTTSAMIIVLLREALMARKEKG